MVINGTFFQVPFLKDSTYNNWSNKMKVVLRAHDVWKIVEKGYNESQNGDLLTQAQSHILKDSRKRDEKAIFLV